MVIEGLVASCRVIFDNISREDNACAKRRKRITIQSRAFIDVMLPGHKQDPYCCRGCQR